MKKLQLIIFSFFYISILLNCTVSNEKTNIFKIVNFTIPHEKSTIESIDWRVHTQGDVNFFTYIDTTSTLYLFDIFRDKIIDSVELKMNDEGIDFRYFPRRICYHKKDSIFILPDDGQHTVFLVNSKGEVKRRWDIKLVLDYSYLLSGYSWNPVEFVNGKLIIRFIPRMSPDANRKVFFNIPPDIVVNLETDSIFRTGIWPKKYSSHNFNDAQTQRIVLENQKEANIIYSFNADHNLYIFREQEFVKEVNAKSDYIDDFDIYSDDSLNNIGYKMRFLTTAPVYNNLFYDVKRKEYYRIALHKTKYIDEETNRKKRAFDRPWSVIILDTNFNIIDEIKFSPKEYRAGPLLMTSEGLLIPHASEDSDFYSFSYSNLSDLR